MKYNDLNNKKRDNNNNNQNSNIREDVLSDRDLIIEEDTIYEIDRKCFERYITRKNNN